MEVRRLPNSSNDELYHHGIKNQQWGVQNGPPYPLDSKTSASVKKKKKNLIERTKDKRKMKKVREAKAKREEEKARRESIINSGDKKAIKKIMHTLSDEEMERAVTRIAFNETIDSQSGNRIDKAVSIVNKYADTASNLGKYADTVSKITKMVRDVNNTINTIKNK